MDQSNPYVSPAAPSFVPPVLTEDGQVKPASQGTRFLNLIIDSVINQVISFGAGMLLGIVFMTVRADPAGTMSQEEESTLQILGFIVGIMSSLTYFIVTEGLFQRSLAKFITGTRVVTVNGGRPSFGQIVGRSFARLIPFEAFSFLGGKGFPVGWHDSLSGTRVVKTR